MPTGEAAESKGVLGASGSDIKTGKDGLMRCQIAADEPARQPPGAVTRSAIAHAKNATRSRVAFLFCHSMVGGNPAENDGRSRKVCRSKAVVSHISRKTSEIWGTP
jgi:hypothetical protein